jgi:hypothetical protein
VLLLDGLDGKRAADGDGDGSEPEMWPGGQSPNLAVHRVEIDQATGMLTVQLGSQPRKPLPGSGPLADFPPGLSLSGLGGLEADLEGILGTRVVLVPAVDLKPDVRQRVESDLIAL